MAVRVVIVIRPKTVRLVEVSMLDYPRLSSEILNGRHAKSSLPAKAFVQHYGFSHVDGLRAGARPK